MTARRTARHLLPWATTALLTAAVTIPATAAHASTGRHKVSVTTATAAADRDLNGDGIPDLLTVGGTSGLASGLWQATGVMGDDSATGTGRVNTPALNIGANGNNIFSDNVPSDFDGAQVITGTFTGRGVQDVLAYYPSGNSAGGAVILKGTGDGSVLQSHLDENAAPINPGTFTDNNGDNPLQLANAYNASGHTYLYPDLIGISGDAANGYYLDYYPNFNGTGGYGYVAQLNTATPTGGHDWNTWTIASTQLSSGTAMFLWNQSTGQLHLWEGVTFTDNGDFTGTLAYTQYQISTNWNRDTTLSTLEAADINGDGVPDLWAVTPAGAVTAYLISDLSTTQAATVRTRKSQNLS